VTDQEQQLQKTSRLDDKRAAEEACGLAEDEARKKAYAEREEKIAADLKAREDRNSANR